MMRFYIFICLFFVVNAMYSMEPSMSVSLNDHLIEVNPEWRKWEVERPKDAIIFTTDTERIQRHLREVIALFEQQKNAGFSESAQLKRAHHLKVLEDYAASAIFPTNHFHQVRRPYFVDGFGVHCAVGYLLAKDRQTDLVETIHTEDNYGYLLDLAKAYPQIGEWAVENGFTVEELALIQPAYPPNRVHLVGPVSENEDFDGAITALSATEDYLLVGGEFTKVGDRTTGCITLFDGVEYVDLPVPITGTVTSAISLPLRPNAWIVAGNLMDPTDGTAYALAMITVDGFEPLLERTDHAIEEIEGIQRSPYDFVIACRGQFSDRKTLLFYNWNNGTGQLTSYRNSVNFNGQVHAIEFMNDFMLFIGGDFTQVTTSNSVFNAQNIAILDVLVLSPSTHTLESTEPVVAGYQLRDTIFYVSESSLGVLTLRSDQRSFELMSLEFQNRRKIDWFLSPSRDLLLFGGIKQDVIAGDLNNGIFPVSVGFQPASTYLPDHGVYGLTSFKGATYIAGDFKTINYQAINNIATIDFYVVPTEEAAFSPALDFIQDGTQFTVQAGYLTDDLTVRIFSLDGKLWHTAPLSSFGSLTFDGVGNGLPPQNFVYHISDGLQAVSGQFFMN